MNLTSTTILNRNLRHIDIFYLALFLSIVLLTCLFLLTDMKLLASLMMGIILVMLAYSYLEFLLSVFLLAMPLVPWALIGFPAGYRGVAFGSLILCFTLYFLIGKARLIRRLLNSATIYNLLLGFTLYVGLINTQYRLYGLHKFQGFILFALLPFIIALLLGQDWNRTCRIYFSVCIIGIWGTITGYYHYLPQTISLSSRFSPSEFNPIWYARLLGTTILSLSFFYSFGSKKVKVATIAPIIPILWLLLLTGSRGPILFYVGFTVLYLLITSFQQKQPRITVILYALGIIIITQLLVSFLPQAIGTRFALMELSSSPAYSARITQWRMAIAGFKSQPVLGIGTGGYSSLDYIFNPLGDSHEYPHNILLETVVENGIIGLSLLGLFTIKILKIIAKSTGLWQKLKYAMQLRRSKPPLSTNQLPVTLRMSSKMPKSNKGFHSSILDNKRLLLLNLSFQFLAAYGCSLVSGNLVTNPGIWFFGGLILATSSWQR